MEIINKIYDIIKFNFYNINKLFTKEDSHYFNIHKILGSITLINYSYRYYLWYNYHNMFIENDIFNTCIIFIHALLSGSSFIFKLSSTRIKVTPIIWHEGRLHSIIFTYRSIFIIFIFFMYWYTHNELLNYLRGIVVLLTIVCADNVTDYYKLCVKTLVEDDSTMRKMPSPEYIPERFMNILNIFYSISQIFATMNCIFAIDIDKIFLLMFPIQIAMFLMTLAKKNIISSAGWHLWYTLSLLLNYYIYIPENTYIQKIQLDIIERLIFIGLSLFFIIFRLKYNYNKYYLWSTIILIHWNFLYFTDKFKIQNL
jgi:hypothetical protein